MLRVGAAQHEAGFSANSKEASTFLQVAGVIVGSSKRPTVYSEGPMSDFERPSSEHVGTPPDQSLLAPPPPPTPAVSNTFWHRLAAGFVVAAVIAAATGAGIGWSLARAISPRLSTGQTITAPQTNPEAPIQPTRPRTGTALDISAIAAKINPAVVDINTVVGSGRAAGTGMIITSSGEVLTNHHVVDGSSTIRVTIAGRSQAYTAHVIGVYPSADVAVIQIEGVFGLPSVSFASSSKVKVGDSVVAIGNALGQGGTPDVSQGNITALDQTITASASGAKAERLIGMLQTDATIYPGDSGGPLVNSSGQVVGMITAGQVQGFRTSASNINYAVASDTFLAIVNQIRSRSSNPAIIYGQVGYIGVSAQTLDAATAAQLGLSVSSGALVRQVEAGSPADNAGIARNSVITAVGGSQVTTIDILGTAIRAHKPGEKVSISWVNQSGTHTASITLGGVNP
ncbi:MAG: trypsin-like peptidase domain-containing protein [Candidatus Dormibacteraceae bacterium]